MIFDAKKELCFVMFLRGARFQLTISPQFRKSVGKNFTNFSFASLSVNKDRQKAEPRMRQYGLNMITNTIDDPVGSVDGKYAAVLRDL